ncbi:MAG: ABC transporter permease [Acidobacteriota bacterium]
MQTLWQDLRYGARMLVKKPVFTFAAALTLALGIGANTAIFSVVNAVLLRSLPYREPHRLMKIENAPESGSGAVAVFLHGVELLGWRDQARSFEHIAAYNLVGNGVNLAGDDPERVKAAEVTNNFFSAIGIEPHTGRAFASEEAGRVAVISHQLWQRRFNSDPDIAGQSISLNGKPATIVGVAPPAFRYPDESDLWVPISMGEDRIFNERVFSFQVVGRLDPAVTLEQARAEMSVLSESLYQQYSIPESERKPIEIIPLLDQLVRDFRPALLILFGAVGFVLLIACANVANLLLARAAARQKEMAIRAALGASRLRLMRQTLVESLLLALAGNAMGLLMAWWGIDLLISISPGDIPRMEEARLDLTVLGFTMLLSLVTGVLSGLAPALHSSKTDLTHALKEGASQSKSFRLLQIKSLLIIAEVALSIVLLAGAGLLIRSFARLQSVDPGFNPRGVLTLALDLPDAKYPGNAQKVAFYQQVIERLKALPQAQYVGAINSLPLGQSPTANLRFTLEGKASPEKTDRYSTGDDFIGALAISPDYFLAMGVPLLQGRLFNERDTKTAQPVVIINQAVARKYWPDENPVGKRITMEGEKIPREIVGVAGRVRQGGLEGEEWEEMYLPYLQAGELPLGAPSALVIRAEDPMKIIATARREIQSLDGDLPLYDIKTMEQRLAQSLAQRRFTLTLLGVFASIALLLAAVGIYGVMSYLVAERTREIGIRLALGAAPRDVMRAILGRGMLLTLIGIATGAASALLLTRLMSSLLYEISPTDPATFIVISLLLAGVALGACFAPARRAVKVDPMIALRSE